MRKEVAKGRILGTAEASGKADSPGDAGDEPRTAMRVAAGGATGVHAVGAPAGRSPRCGRAQVRRARGAALRPVPPSSVEARGP